MIAHDAAKLSGVLEVVEPVGNEIFLNLAFGDSKIVVRTPPRGLPDPGSRVALTYAQDALHFFDPLTQRRIG